MIYAITDIQANKCYFPPSLEVLTNEQLGFRFSALYIAKVGLSPTNISDRMATRVQDLRTYSPQYS